MKTLLATALLLALAGCTSAPPAPSASAGLWTGLQSLCGQAFEGRLVEGTEPSDAEIGAQRLVMHVRSCSAEEVRVPFHVGENRSRTWVITRQGQGLRLKHDHRHEDGSEDEVTQYGGDSRPITEPLSIDFPADAFTARMLPAAATNIWTVAIVPEKPLPTHCGARRRDGASGSNSI